MTLALVTWALAAAVVAGVPDYGNGRPALGTPLVDASDVAEGPDGAIYVLARHDLWRFKVGATLERVLGDLPPGLTGLRFDAVGRPLLCGRDRVLSGREEVWHATPGRYAIAVLPRRDGLELVVGDAPELGAKTTFKLVRPGGAVRALDEASTAVLDRVWNPFYPMPYGGLCDDAWRFVADHKLYQLRAGAAAPEALPLPAGCFAEAVDERCRTYLTDGANALRRLDGVTPVDLHLATMAPATPEVGNQTNFAFIHRVVALSSLAGDGGTLALIAHDLDTTEAMHVALVREGKAVAIAGCPTPQLAEPLDQPLQVAGIANGPDGELWIADRVSHRVLGLRPGKVARVVAGCPYGRRAATGARATDVTFVPRGIGADAAGRAYVLDDATEAVYRIEADGTLTRLFGGKERHQPFEAVAMMLAVAPDGTLYVGDQGNRDDGTFEARVYQVSARGEAQRLPVAVDQLAGLALAPDGQLAILGRHFDEERGDRTIGWTWSATQGTRELALDQRQLPETMTPGFGPVRPVTTNGLAVDRQGRWTYITVDGDGITRPANRSLVRFDPATKRTDTIPLAAGFVTFPAYRPDGTLLVADQTVVWGLKP